MTLLICFLKYFIVANVSFVLGQLNVTEGSQSSLSVCISIDAEVGEGVDLIVQVHTSNDTAIGKYPY